MLKQQFIFNILLNNVISYIVVLNLIKLVLSLFILEHKTKIEIWIFSYDKKIRVPVF